VSLLTIPDVFFLAKTEFRDFSPLDITVPPPIAEIIARAVIILTRVYSDPARQRQGLLLWRQAGAGETMSRDMLYRSPEHRQRPLAVQA